MSEPERNGNDIDPIEGLRQLEKLISEAEEYDTKQKVTFNGNKMLNDLLDKPLTVGAGDDQQSDEERHSEEDDNQSDEPKDEPPDEDVDEEVEKKVGEEKGVKRQKSDDESEEDKEVTDKKTPQKSSTQKNKKSKNSSAKKKKSSNPTLRKNIKNILKETELDKETQLARKEEEERIARQRERWQEMQQKQIQSLFPLDINPTVNNNLQPKRYSEISDEILLSSDDEDDKQTHKPVFKHKASLELIDTTEVIDLSSSDEETDPPKRSDHYMNGCDDEVAILDSSQISSDSDMEDANNCGLHTDDSLNTWDSEGRVLVNVGHPPEDPDIYLAPQIARKVKPHQIGGIRFLYDNVVESLERVNKSTGFGCILSHSMGLGKTMQVISFIDVFLSHSDAKFVLCIVPINTLQNWISEFNMWLPEDGTIDKFFKKDETNGDVKYRTFKVFAINEAKSTTTRAKTILSWRKFGGVLLLGYEMYRILTAVNNRNKSKKDEDIDPKILDQINSEVRAALIDPGPDLIVCDEGHRIKNCNAATSQALKNIRTKRRIVLTGYPLQNKLLEYWCMVDFVRPNYLGLKNEFTNMFERPITNGQCSDSTPHDRQIMKYRAHVLYQLLKGFVQRRSHSVLKGALPQKCEYVLMCRMTPIQKQLMLAFLDTAINDPEAIGTAKGRISTLTLFAVCCKVWNHPDIVYDIIRKGLASDDFDIDFPTKNKPQSKTSKKKKEKSEPINDCQPILDETINPFNDIPNDLFDAPLRQKNEGVLDWTWAEEKLGEYVPGLLEHSFKMILLFDIIAECMAINDRLLVFSQSLLTLDLIERFLQSTNIPKTNTKWAKNQSYYRLDGSTSAPEREKYINLFNNTKSAHLFLISTRAGSLGINLIGANRIVIFDASWNPCHDAQAACRIYRYGQPKPCYIYRLVCDNSLEKKIYDRQVNKQGMANRVVDEHNTEANFTWREIHALMDDLHEIKEPPVEDYTEEQLSRFNDELIKKICTKDNHCITRLPFEHESLLLDRKESKLSSAEKRMAFGNYNDAKRMKSLGMDYTSIRNPMMARNYPNSMPYSPSVGLPYGLPSQMTPTPNYLMNMGSYPDVSQPLPPYPPQARGQSSNHFMNFESIAETLVKNGNSVKKVRIPSDLSINVGPNSVVNIRKGEEVMVIETQKGVYLRTNEGNIISIKNANPLAPHILPSFMSASKRVSALNQLNTSNICLQIIQPNLGCGGTVHCATPTHSRASSTVSHPPEVVQLSDDEDSPDAIDRALDQSVNLNSGLDSSSENGVFNGNDSGYERRSGQTTSNSNSTTSEASDRSHDMSGLTDPTFATAMETSTTTSATADMSFHSTSMGSIDFEGIDTLEI